MVVAEVALVAVIELDLFVLLFRIANFFCLLNVTVRCCFGQLSTTSSFCLNSPDSQSPPVDDSEDDGHEASGLSDGV